MFFLHALGKLVFGDDGKRILITIERGRLFLETPCKNAPPKKKNIYKECEISLVRKDAPFTYEIVVKNKEAKQSILSFDVKEDMVFQKVEINRSTVFKWLKPDSNGAFYSFYVDQELTDLTSEMFHISVGQCIFEFLNKKSYKQASEEQLQKILFPGTESEKESVSINETPLPRDAKKFFTGKPADLYILDPEENLFILRVEKITPIIYKTPSSEFYFVLEIKKERIHTQEICSNTSQHFDRTTSSYVWCYSQNGNSWTLCIRFSTVEPLLEFSTTMGECLYEIYNKDTKVDQEDEKYLFGQMIDDEEFNEAMSEDSAVDMSDEEEFFEECNESEEGRNKHLLIGHKNDNLFVSRGKNIGVFRSKGKGNVEFQSNLKIASLSDKKRNESEKYDVI
eukprot:GHVP01025503.1.p1 GENE.GHVP01025503.1~~GHVP01025503.1.p1  ORF type:complete len:395 (-),score=71.37 GHVP01025503.1:880-2064(-)